MPPPVFFGLPKDVGERPPDAKLYPGYIRIYQVDIHRSKKQTAYDLCELLLLVFEDTQKRILLLRNLWSGWLLEL